MHVERIQSVADARDKPEHDGRQICIRFPIDKKRPGADVRPGKKQGFGSPCGENFLSAPGWA